MEEGHAGEAALTDEDDGTWEAKGKNVPVLTSLYKSTQLGCRFQVALCFNRSRSLLTQLLLPI